MADSAAAHYPCSHCERVFKHAWRRTSHVADAHPVEPWRCGNCGKELSGKSALNRHMRTKHRDEHRFACPTCDKSFDDKRWLANHVRAHTRAGLETLVPPQGFWEQLQSSAARERSLMQQIAVTAFPNCSQEGCAVATRDRAEKAYMCSECERYWPSKLRQCSGYVKELLSTLSQLICPLCLGRSVDTCFMAATNRRLLEAHVVATKSTLQNVPADGWCLVRSVALALSKDHRDLLTEALTRLLDIMHRLVLDDSERTALAETCQTLLQQKTRLRMHNNWDSALMDQLPTALASVAQRPLHICEVSAGVIRLVVVPPLLLSDG